LNAVGSIENLNIAIANSQPVFNELRAEGILEQKLMLIHNGIDAVKMKCSIQIRRGIVSLFHGALSCSALSLTCVRIKVTRIYAGIVSSEGPATAELAPPCRGPRRRR
jgi:hypothetical protein